MWKSLSTTRIAGAVAPLDVESCPQPDAVTVVTMPKATQASRRAAEAMPSRSDVLTRP
jgi:hypothetical protein